MVIRGKHNAELESNTKVEILKYRDFTDITDKGKVKLAIITYIYKDFVLFQLITYIV